MKVKLNRLLHLMRTGNVRWLLHRLRLLFFPLYEHPSARFFVESQKMTPIAMPEKEIKRVLFVSHDLQREGAAISLFEIIRVLRVKLSFTVQVLAFGDGPMAESYASLGIPVKVMSKRMDELTTPARLHAFSREISGEIQAFAPQFVFANTLFSFPAIYAAQAEGIPSAWNIREGVSPEIGFRGLPFAVARLAVSCVSITNCVVFVSKSTCDKWKAYESIAHFEIIPNAINPDRIYYPSSCERRRSLRQQFGLKPDSFVFLNAGSLEARKGQMDLIRAFHELPEDIRQRCEILFLGDRHTPYFKKLKHNCSKSLSSSIHFADSFEMVSPFFEISDAFVLCSRSESYPRVVLEAMAAGLPVITTPVDGVPEQVLENVNAFYYNPYDFKTLSNQMVRLLTDPKLSGEMGRRSREIYKSFTSFESMMNCYAALLTVKKR